jgi:hypothetical protein
LARYARGRKSWPIILAVICALGASSAAAEVGPAASVSDDAGKALKKAKEALGLARSADRKASSALRRANKVKSLGGVAGPQGPPGPQGARGPEGFDGRDGDPGPAGPPGSAGATGPAGATGARGATGPAGTPGTAGVAGAPGVTPSASATREVPVDVDASPGPVLSTDLDTGPGTRIFGLATIQARNDGDTDAVLTCRLGAGTDAQDALSLSYRLELAQGHTGVLTLSGSLGDQPAGSHAVAASCSADHTVSVRQGELQAWATG